MIIVIYSSIERDIKVTESRLFFIAQDLFKPTIDGWLFFAFFFIDIQTIQSHMHIYLNVNQFIRLSS